jgi:hypothetical protein
LSQADEAAVGRKPEKGDVTMQATDSHSPEKTLIVYGAIEETFLGPSLFFFEKSEALHMIHVKRTVSACDDTGITWGEFRDRHPAIFEEVYQYLIDAGVLTFADWFDEHGEGYTLSVEDLSGRELEKAKEAYRNHLPDGYGPDRLPLAEEFFDLCWRYPQEMHDWFTARPKTSWCVPDDIHCEFGKTYDPPMADMFTIFDPKHEQAIVDRLKKQGCVCERDDELVASVFFS